MMLFCPFKSIFEQFLMTEFNTTAGVVAVFSIASREQHYHSQRALFSKLKSCGTVC